MQLVGTDCYKYRGPSKYVKNHVKNLAFRGTLLRRKILEKLVCAGQIPRKLFSA